MFKIHLLYLYLKLSPHTCMYFIYISTFYITLIEIIYFFLFSLFFINKLTLPISGSSLLMSKQPRDYSLSYYQYKIIEITPMLLITYLCFVIFTLVTPLIYLRILISSILLLFSWSLPNYKSGLTIVFEIILFSCNQTFCRTLKIIFLSLSLYLYFIELHYYMFHIILKNHHYSNSKILDMLSYRLHLFHHDEYEPINLLFSYSKVILFICILFYFVLIISSYLLLISFANIQNCAYIFYFFQSFSY